MIARKAGLFLLFAPLLGEAWAGPGDVFGLGGRSMGRGGEGIAHPEGAEAVWLNPADLGGLSHSEFSIGYAALRTHFDAWPRVYWDTNQDGIVDATDTTLDLGPDDAKDDGVMVGVAARLGARIGLGFMAFAPAGRLVNIASEEPSFPDYVMYNQRLQRFDMATGLGVNVWRGLHLGVGAQVLASSKVNIVGTLRMSLQSAQDGDTDASQLISDISLDTHTISLDVYPEIIPVFAGQWNLGDLWDPLKGLSLAGSWRKSGGLPVDVNIDLQADVSVTGQDMDPIALALLAPIELSFLDHYVPQRIQFGASYQWKNLGFLTVDVDRTGWSEFEPSIAQVVSGKVHSPLMSLEDPEIHDGNPYKLTLKDTTAVHTGLELRVLHQKYDKGVRFLRVALRGGWAYEPSPLVEQGKGTAFLDADRMMFTGGLGVSHGDPFGLVHGPISWDLFFQQHLIASGALKRTDDPYTAGAPVDGKSIPIGGKMIAAGIQWSIGY